MNIGFLVISGMMIVSGLLWLMGTKFLEADTARVEAR
jgi:hypothetical protein